MTAYMMHRIMMLSKPPSMAGFVVVSKCLKSQDPAVEVFCHGVIQMEVIDLDLVGFFEGSLAAKVAQGLSH